MRGWVLPLVAACGGAEPTPTFHEDIAPILDTHCMGCHAAGGIGPMAFETFEQTRDWAQVIDVVAHARTMPPKQVVGDGSCGDFVEPGWLSDDELATIAAWVEGGTPEGPPRERAAAPEPVVLDATVTTTTPEFSPVPVGSSDAEFDEYRCFVVDFEPEGGSWLTGFEVVPGNLDTVHHVIGMFVDPAAQGRYSLSNGDQIAANDALSPDRAGWPCYTEAGDGVAISSDPVVWAPGAGVIEMPAGTGVRVPDDALFVVQVHYNLVDPATRGSSDQTGIRLRLEDSVDRELFPFYVDYLLGTRSRIPAGESAYVYRQGYTVRDIIGVPLELDIHAIMPHMHERGRKLKATIQRADGTAQCMAKVENWNFDWQYAYFYREPVRIRADDAWQIACTYDTSDATDDIRPGWGTKNEMCLTTLWLSLAQ